MFVYVCVFVYEREREIERKVVCGFTCNVLRKRETVMLHCVGSHIDRIGFNHRLNET
jgi:hypothetical protein